MDSITADRRPTILTIVVTLWVLSAVAVGLRILVRHVTHQALWWDDWLALGSWVRLSCLYCFICFVMIAGSLTVLKITFTPKAVMFMISVVSLGAGKHAALVSAANYQQFLKYVYWVGLVYPVAISMAKASIILLYLRLFGVQKYFARTCYFLLGITFCWGISILFTSIFQCTPIHAAWRNVPNATCIKVKLFFYCSIIPDCLLDALIFIMPLYPIWKLKLPVTKKVQITGALILGASLVDTWFLQYVTLADRHVGKLYSALRDSLHTHDSPSWMQRGVSTAQ